MRIAFVSTILGYPWGGADALWTSAAEVAEARGDRLLLAITESTARHARIDALAGRGATLFIRPGGGGPASLWKRAWGRCPLSARHPLRLAKRIRAFAPDLVILSCGGTYDPILEPALMDWLRKTGNAKGFDYAGKPVVGPLVTGQIAIGVRKGDTAMKAKLDAAIDQLIASPDYDKMSGAYFPFSIKP